MCKQSRTCAGYLCASIITVREAAELSYSVIARTGHLSRHRGAEGGSSPLAKAGDASCLEDDIDLTTGRLHVRRAKSGDASVHPISARETRALRKLLREAATSPYVFISERRSPLSVAGYQRMVARAGLAAKFTFLVHSHMLRHACGFKLANDGHDTRAIQAYLGQEEQRRS
jgi:Phage integrase family